MMQAVNANGGQRLAKRLVLLTLLASGLIAAFITAAQLYLEYDREVRSIEQRFVEIAAEALFRTHQYAEFPPWQRFVDKLGVSGQKIGGGRFDP